LGAPAHRASAPAARASPNIAIIIRRLMKNPDKRGGKGMLPLGCLPLWGRERVTLLAAAENKRITGKRGFQQSKKNLIFLEFFEKNQIFHLFFLNYRNLSRVSRSHK
jgi:hypothetical protein